MNRGGRISRMVCCTLLACAVLLSLTGCNAEEKAMARAFLLEYMEDEYGVDASDGIGLDDLFGLGASVVTNPEKAREAKAAMDAYTVIDTINKADKAMDEGRSALKNGDAEAAGKKMDEAIKSRPGDWTYRMGKANLALQTGDVGEAQKQFEAVDAIAVKESLNTLDFHSKQILELQDAHANITEGLGDLPADKEDRLAVTFGRLVTEHRARAALYRAQGNERSALEDEDTADSYLDSIERIEAGSKQ